jgi:hypothetical protein
MQGFSILKRMLVTDCNGNVGLLKTTLDHLGSARSISQPFESEEAAISYYLELNLSILYGSRFWGVSDPLTSVPESFAIRAIADEAATLAEVEESAILKQCMKAGILICNDDTNAVQFSSNLARRYFSQSYFKNRASNHEDCKSLEDLTKAAIGKLSASVLRASVPRSVLRVNYFPKEATFQHLFMNCLLVLTPPTVKILPELSKSYRDLQPILGEIDFYLANRNINWGIELLIQGRHVGEHVKRFGPGGQYEGLRCNSYIVIDFRWGPPTNSVLKTPNKMTVFFNSPDYRMCHYVLGMSNIIQELELQA